MAPGAPGSDQKGDLGRQPRRPQRERVQLHSSRHQDQGYNKKRLREIDRRVRYLTKCLEQLKIVDYSPQQEGKVFFGAWVEIENDEGDIKRFRIVGYDEIFGRKDYISIDSPMARALLKKEVGDLAIVNTPAGEASWYVNEIEYVK